MCLVGMGFDSKCDFSHPTVLLGFSFALGHGVSFFGGIQHSPVDGCLAVSCSFGVLIEEDEGMSYSTILELCYVMHGESCMDVRVGP